MEGRALSARGPRDDDDAALELSPPEDSRDDDPSSLGLYALSPPAGGGRREDRFLPGARRSIQPELGAGPQGPRLLRGVRRPRHRLLRVRAEGRAPEDPRARPRRSEEHTSELQSQSNLVCRLLLEKKKHEATASDTRVPASCTMSPNT